MSTPTRHVHTGTPVGGTDREPNRHHSTDLRGGGPSATTLPHPGAPNHQNSKEHQMAPQSNPIPLEDDEEDQLLYRPGVGNVVAFPATRPDQHQTDDDPRTDDDPGHEQEREHREPGTEQDGAGEDESGTDANGGEDGAADDGSPGVVDGEVVSAGRAKAVAELVGRELAPILPVWLTDRAQLAANARWTWRFCHHTARYHAVRTPLYAARLAARAPRGAARSVAAWHGWAYDRETLPLRSKMVDGGEAAAYLALRRQRDLRVAHRLKVSAGVTFLVLIGVAVLLLAAPELLGSVLWSAGLLGLLVFGLIGRREDKPIAAPAVVGQAVMKLTPDVVIRAFVGAGLCKPDNPITFAQPIQRDGKGWLAVVDLPYGTPASKAMKKLDELASGLHVNPVMVFLDADQVSARRVRLWVSDIDVFAQKPVVSPLVKMERFDFWKPVPFGMNARDRRIVMPLIWSSLLVGAIPRMGKTFCARIPATAAALDPFVELFVFNGKGDSAWTAFEKVAVAYGSGVRTQIVELLVSTLKKMVVDMNDRFERMSKLPVDVCPEAKLTPALSRNKRMRMPLTLLAIDEVQRYLEDETHGKTILDLLTDLAKVGPAAGYMLILATQKPDGQVIPDSLRGQLGTRFAMKVMTWQASDTILGAGAYASGLDASKLKRSHKGTGILLGADDGELAEEGGQTVRSDLLTSAEVQAACERGRALRVAEGTLSGMAAGDIPAQENTSSILDDVAAALAAVSGTAAGAHTETLLGQLAQMRPELYDGWSATTLAGALKPHGVEPDQVWAATEGGPKRNRQGYKTDAVIEAQSRRIDNTQ